MKKYITILILFSTVSLSQEASTGNILEDHDKAVEGILSDEIKKQTQIINKALSKRAAADFLCSPAQVRLLAYSCVDSRVALQRDSQISRNDNNSLTL